MKKVINPTLSKHPILVPDENDAMAYHAKIAAIGEDKLRLEGIQKILENDADYLKSVLLSKERIMQIVLRMLDIDLNESTLLEHAEIRGQLRERILLTKELEGVKSAIKVKERTQNRFSEMIKKMFVKTEVKEKTDGQA